jgi:light-regulated signal transduction histidine kinase (bacteriophytochrome)
MEGFDTDWTTVTARDRSVTYTNLDPGNYIFKLRGTNSDGIWSPAEKSVTVTINPPFWLTWWFRLLWASVLTGSVFYIYRLRIRRIKKQNMILEERIEQRTRELREKTHQLEITNEELESFAYSVSHDLRSPLRAISGYSSMIMEEYAEKIENKEIREYLHRIKSGSHQMSDLIDAILKLTRLTRGNLSKSNVNLSDLAREIIDRLKERDPGRRVRIVIGKDLTAWGDPTLLRTMLQNLLENAWKFTQNTQKPVIKFARMNKTGELAEKNTFFIQDNGTGFDMHYSDKLFQPFQRLHTASEYPGTGIGLATVKRIINRHGGTIWVDSIPATKTIFYFTLPDKTIQLY